MKVFLWGSSLFCFAVLLHLVIWKIRLPKNQLAALLKIFFLVFVAWLTFTLAQYSGYIPNYIEPLSFPELIYISLFLISLCLSYVAAYSTVEADSPSLKITMTIYNTGLTGLDKHDLIRLFNMDKFIKSRVNRLIEDRMINMEDGKYTISPKGRLLMNIVVYYRKFLGARSDLG